MYVAADAPATTGLGIDFRQMLHKIHQGRDLADAENYVVVGFFGRSITFDEIGFPSFVGGTSNCDSCHGDGNTAWYAPTDRLHPTQAFTAPQSNWNLVCASCHDDRAALAHIQSNTSASGLESCAVCHGDDKILSVELVHRNFVR
jgi:OmcA/MtrC family decaheme c-type cytochrome